MGNKFLIPQITPEERLAPHSPLRSVGTNYWLEINKYPEIKKKKKKKNMLEINKSPGK